MDEVSEAMGMILGLRKCAIAHMSKGTCREGESMTGADSQSPVRV